jgi:hypothetical protein
MSWKRRWGIVTVLALVQAGIIICYQGFFAGSAAPANPPSGDTTVVAARHEPPRSEPATTPAVAPADVPPPPEFKLPPELSKSPAADMKPTTAEPPQLPAGLQSAPSIPGPPAPPVTALPDSSTLKQAGDPPPGGEKKVVPVSANDPEPPSGGATPLRGTPLPDLMPIAAQAPAPPAVPPGQATSTPKPADPSPVSPPPASEPTKPGSSLTSPAPLPSGPQELKGPPPGIAPGSQAGDPLVGTPAPNPAPSGGEPKKPEPAAEGPCPWTLRVEIIKGRTLLTAQTGKEVQFRVDCDKLDLQAPRGCIQASGNVRVASDGLRGACEKLTIAWQKDQVVLEGTAELKCQRDGQEVDLKAAKLTLRLTVSARPEVTRGSGRPPGEVRGTTFLSRSKSAHGEVRTTRPRPDGSGRNVVQPVGGSNDGTYDRYPGNEPPPPALRPFSSSRATGIYGDAYGDASPGNEPPRRGSKIDD